MGGNFWWILTGTDGKTQRTEIQPTWNHDMYAPLDAPKTAGPERPGRKRRCK